MSPTVLLAEMSLATLKWASFTLPRVLMLYLSVISAWCWAAWGLMDSGFIHICIVMAQTPGSLIDFVKVQNKNLAINQLTEA